MYSGTLSSNTPTWGGRPASSCFWRNRPRRFASIINCRKDHVWSPKNRAGRSSSALARRSAAAVVTKPGRLPSANRSTHQRLVGVLRQPQQRLSCPRDRWPPLPSQRLKDSQVEVVHLCHRPSEEVL